MSDSPPRRSSRRSQQEEELPTNAAAPDDVGGRSEPPTPPSFRSTNKSKHALDNSPGNKTVGTHDTTLTINHVTSTSRSSAVLGLSKPVVALIGILSMGTLGAGLWGWITIPGLNSQIEKLELQVSRLSGEIDRLQSEVDRFAELNANLNASIVELNQINQNLNATVDRLEDEVDELEEQNDIYQDLNNQLNTTAVQLSEQVDELEEQVDQLEESNAELRILTQDLQNQTDRLESQVDELEKENDRLQELNKDLAIIVGFLNETTGDISDTLLEVSELLADQIVVYQGLVLDDLNLMYIDVQQCWDCNYFDFFRGEPWITDTTIPIGDSLIEALDYVDDRILDEYCIDRADFEDYLDDTFGLEVMSSDNLIRGVNRYTNAVLEYYFPDQNSTLPGLNATVWHSAMYDCANVPTFDYDTMT